MSSREDFLNSLKPDKETQEKIDNKNEEIRERYNEDGSLKKESSDKKEDSGESDDFDDMSSDLKEKEMEMKDRERERSRELTKETDDGEMIR